MCTGPRLSQGFVQEHEHSPLNILLELLVSRRLNDFLLGYWLARAGVSLSIRDRESDDDSIPVAAAFAVHWSAKDAHREAAHRPWFKDNSVLPQSLGHHSPQCNLKTFGPRSVAPEQLENRRRILPETATDQDDNVGSLDTLCTERDERVTGCAFDQQY